MSPPRDLRIALGGEGAMGRVHAGVLSARPGVRMTSLVAGDAAAGAAFAAEWKIPDCSPQIEDCLRRDDVDALVIASPSGLHVSIGLRARRSGTLVTMALSFNHQGPFGGFYRYIGEEGTFHVFRDTIKDGDGAVVALADGATPAFEAQDRAFVDALRTGTRPECDADAVLPAMRLLDRIERAMNEPRAA